MDSMKLKRVHKRIMCLFYISKYDIILGKDGTYKIATKYIEVIFMNRVLKYLFGRGKAKSELEKENIVDIYEEKKKIELTSDLLLDNIKKSLDGINFDYDTNIYNFEHIKNVRLREGGKEFSFNEHLRGLIFSLLSNQRPWGPIEENRNRITEIFYEFDKDKILKASGDIFEQKLRNIRCGNRAIKSQMESLNYNIGILEKVEKDYGSLDNYVTSDSPYKIAKEFASGNRYKLKQIGFALALEYLRNIGIDAIKPDLHILRILSNDRLGYLKNDSDSNGAVVVIEKISYETGSSQSYIDALLWMFCADSYGNICSSNPRCYICKLNDYCNYGKGE